MEKAMMMAAIEVFNNPKLVNTLKEELTQQKFALRVNLRISY